MAKPQEKPPASHRGDYHMYNHNNTWLGSHKTRKEADKECRFYTSQTGNAAYVDTVAPVNNWSDHPDSV